MLLGAWNCIAKVSQRIPAGDGSFRAQACGIDGHDSYPRYLLSRNPNLPGTMGLPTDGSDPSTAVIVALLSLATQPRGEEKSPGVR